MGFFDKLKESASKAADKAKDSVEVVRLNSQISAKRGEIEKVYAEIGRIVFQAHTAGSLSSVQELIQTYSDQIIAIQQEILQLEHKIKVIKAEKDCVCGQVLPLEAKFCSTCGHKYEENREEQARIEVNPEALIEVAALQETNHAADPNENEEVPAADKACPTCEAALQHSDRFCENCGTPVN